METSTISGVGKETWGVWGRETEGNTTYGIRVQLSQQTFYIILDDEDGK